MSVARAQREMSSSEFTEWRAFYELEPFGDWRADLRVARLTQITAEVNRDSKKRPEPYEVRDFMWDPEPKKTKRQSHEYIASMCETWLTAHQGKAAHG